MLLESYNCSKEYINFEPKIFVTALTKIIIIFIYSNWVVTQ